MTVPHAAGSLRSTGRNSASWLKCIGLTAVLVGLADFVQSYLLFALARDRPAIGVLQGPATGLLGRAAMEGGARTAALGTALHFGIAFAWTVAFALMYRALPSLRRQARTTAGVLNLAALAGVVVWLAMDWLVLRFSKAHYYPVSEAYFWLLLLGHIPFVGLPLVSGVARWCPSPNDVAPSPPNER